MDDGPAGHRMLVGAAGFTVRVSTRSWRDGADAIRRIDAAAPKSVVVPFALA